MVFPLEKILTVTAGDYVKSVEKELKDYKLVGVNFHTDVAYPKVNEEFSSKVPENAEVVTDYKFFMNGYTLVSGTALILKE